MAPSIRKALGAVKDQTTIGLAKVSSSSIDPELDVAVVKATSHDNDPADDKYIREILSLTSYSRAHVSACLAAVSRRLSRTHDWIVALKALMLVHRLLSDGHPSFQNEILYATRRGTRLLNMSDFRDEAHSHSWDQSAFVRTYALYLDQRLECMLYERKASSSNGSNTTSSNYQSPRQYRLPSPGGYHYSDYGDPDAYGGSGSSRHSASSPPQQQKPQTPLRDMRPERILARMHQLQQLLDRFLACRPTGTAKNCRMILVALYPIVKESFQLYADICEILAVLLDKFFDMDYPDCVKSFEAYASAAKQIDELAAFYAWSKDIGIARSSEFPEVQRITDKLLETLEEFMRDRARRPKSPEKISIEAVPVEDEAGQDMNSIKALPAPEDYKEEEPVVQKSVEKPAEPEKKPPTQQEGDLLNLRDDAPSAEDQSNRLALALFSAGGPAANGTNGSWEAFPADGSAGGNEVTSAWQTPAAESGKEGWELALVETASNLTKQKATLAGGFDPLLLNGMYDQGAVRQHVNNVQVSGGSASSVALPGPGQNSKVLALPAPDGTVQNIGHDPFAASLSIPAPSYVQMSDLEKKQQLLTQEQLMWQKYAQDGMQGQASLAKLQNGYMYPNPAMPYGMPSPINGIARYYYPPY